MAWKLKNYQKNTIGKLEDFLTDARIMPVDAAFAKHAGGGDGRIPQYRKVKGLEPIPYVCLRLPTGGGKTVLAAHSISVAGKAYLEEDYPLVLWLVPTNTIRTQTLEALKQPAHPYRQVIDEAYGGKVEVFDIGEIERIRPQDLMDRVCVVVGTLATLRVTDTEGRRIYAHNENFESHFSSVPQSTPGLDRIEDGPDKGKIKYSFANLLHLHRPLVIMDEAHNARTRLTFEVLARVYPACIIEFTATPDSNAQSGSNVLYRVSASELKAEEMIKLPIMLTEHPNWQDAVSASLRTRRQLAAIAEKDPEFVRPLELFQAENKDKPVNVDVLKAHLIENEKLSPEQIAIATGDQRDLDGIDLFDPNSKVEAIITVQALKEGWDCSFAYVFCSVANIRSAKDIEQLLGRVLRMPYAKRRPFDELNRAYAHVSSPNFAEAANQLRDTLVDMGFEEEEAQQAIESVQAPLPGMEDLPLFAQGAPLRLLTDDQPVFIDLTSEEQAQIHVQKTDAGKVEITITGEVSESLASKLVEALPPTAQPEVIRVVAAHREQQERTKAPARLGKEFKIPRLGVWVQGQLELAEKETFLGASGWSLLDYPTELPDFAFDDKSNTFQFDLSGSRIVWELVKEDRQLALGQMMTPWTQNDLALWLDKELRQPDISQPMMVEFLRRVISNLIEKQRFDLDTLIRAKFILAKALLERIKQYREQAYAKGYQDTLFGLESAVDVSFDIGFEYPKDFYPANWFYSGSYKFSKHYYQMPGEMKPSGEEFQCAQAIDRLDVVEYWVRNLSQQPKYSFWLPTSTDNFYPDFVAKLKDGRLLVVEYKGDPYKTNDDSKEKKLLGELWEAKSKGQGLFLMAEHKDASGKGVYEQLLAKIA